MVSGMANNTKYYWRVNAKNAAATTAYSTIWNFTTLIAIPDVPVLASPADGSVDQPVQIILSWNAAARASSYRLQVSKNGGFTAIVFDNSTLSGTSQQLVLAHDSTYYWRVRAKNDGGLSAYSNTRSFTTVISPPPTPILVSPTDGATSQILLVTLSWNSLPTADTYYLQVASDAGFTQLIVRDSLLTDTSMQMSSLNYITTYYWRVRAKNVGGSSAWTPSWQFTTRENLPLAVLNLSSVNFGKIEAQSAYKDTAILLTNDGGANLIVSSIILEGSNEYTIRSGGGSNLTIQPAQSQIILVRFTPTTLGVKACTLKIASNNPGGVVFTLLSGEGIDTTPPIKPNAVVTPSGWSNQSSLTIAWTQPSTDVSGITRARYKYDSMPNVSDSGAILSISGMSTNILPPSLGIHTLYFWLIDGSGNTGQPAVLDVKFDNMPPVIQHDSTQVASFELSSPQAISIQGSASDAVSGMRSMNLQFRRSGTSWNNIHTTGQVNFSGNSSTIPASFIYNHTLFGVDYRIGATDSANNTAFTPTHSIVIHMSTTVTRTDTSGKPVVQISANTLPPNTPKEYAYRMYSVPLILDNKTPQNVLENLSGLGAYDDARWRFFRLTTDDVFEEYPAFATQSVIEPGKAFFLILKDSSTLKVGSGTVPRTETYNKDGIALKPNYNAVGNPFNFDIPLDSLSLSDGQSLKTKSKWSFVGVGGTNGGWKRDPDTLKAWEGILLKLGGSEFTNLRFHVADRPQAKLHPPARIAEVNNEDQVKTWKLHLDAQRLDNGLRDEENIVGTSLGATDSVDDLDYFEPPMVGEKSLSLSFVSGEGALTHDFRSPRSEGWVWDFKVQSPDRDAKIDLKFKGIDSLPAEQFLIDADSKMVYKLNRTREVTINTLSGMRKFRLIVGSRSFADSNNLGIDLSPRSFVLHQNYPNPFNPSTTIRFGLPVRSMVKISVYDILGRKVTVLGEGEWTDGFHEIEWVARVSTGIYFYRIEATATDNPNDRYMAVKKMVLMK
jgi:hypothetical protein